jgi:mono/diheme cytochrome c family protein
LSYAQGGAYSSSMGLIQRRSVLAGVLLAGLWWAPSEAQGDAKKGAELFDTQQCGACHSVAGKGNKKYPLDGAGSRLSAAEIREWLVNPDAQQAKKNGSRPLLRMRSYRDLPAEDLDALVAYVQTLK